MKQTRVLFVMLCLSLSAVSLPYAQARKHITHSKPTKAQTVVAQKQFLSKLLKKSGGAPTVRSTDRTTDTVQVAERLIAQVDYNYIMDSFNAVFGTRDSFTFTYSDYRTSFFNYNYMLYSNVYNMNGQNPYGFGAMSGFIDNGNWPDMLSDTAMMWQYKDALYYLLLGEWRFTIYDSNNNILSYQDSFGAMYGTGAWYINTFDTNSHITSSLAYVQDTTAWDTSEYRWFTYDTLGNLLQDSTFLYLGGSAWMLEEEHTYYYDSLGNLMKENFYLYDTTNLIWNMQYTNVMTYDSNNHLTNFGVYFPDTTGLQVWLADSLGWTSGVNYTTYSKECDYSSGALQDSIVTTRHLTTDGLTDTLYNISYDTTGTPYQNYSTWFAYDGYNEPVIAVDNYYDTSTGNYDLLFGTTNYYYAKYGKRIIKSGVNAVAAPNQIFTVYPNPATTFVTITATEPITVIEVYNIYGQVVLKQVCNTKKLDIDVSMFSPGVYLMRVNGIYLSKVLKE